MSATYRCDNCGKVMLSADCGRLKMRLEHIEIEVMHCWHGTWNNGHVCHKCIKRVVNKGRAVS